MSDLGNFGSAIVGLAQGGAGDPAATATATQAAAAPDPQAAAATTATATAATTPTPRGSRRANPSHHAGHAQAAATPGGDKRKRISTPTWLRFGMVVTVLPVLAFAAAVHVGLDRNADTIQTVGEDATRGITVAQQLKMNLAELDAIAVEHLVTPAELGESGFPEAYNTKRVELQRALIAAAGESPGPAYGQTLANIDYVLGHYHSQMADTFAAAAAQDQATVVTSYDEAHAIMRTTLLPEAERFDRAHTYVLNDSYGRQKDRSLATAGWIGGTWTILVALLVFAQLLVGQKFHRVLSLPLLLATLLAVGALGVTLSGLERSADKLGDARDQAFDAIHKLARARSTAVEAQQAQGDHLLDPADSTAKTSFDGHAARLFHETESEDGDAGAVARGGYYDGSEGGYLGSVVNADVGSVGLVDAQGAVEAFGSFLQVDENMRQMGETGDRPAAVAAVYGEGNAYQDLDMAIATAQGTGQEEFDEDTEAAEDLTRGLPLFNLAAAGGIALLILTGFWLRLREYTR